MGGGFDTRMDIVLRSKIDDFEAYISGLPETIDVATFELKHHFTDNGLYAREMIIPAGVIVTGKIKKHEHISVLSAGLVTEVTEAGLQNIRAPYTMVSLPGTKRIVWAHETTVWTTIHAVDTTDLARVEEELIACNYSDVAELISEVVK